MNDDGGIIRIWIIIESFNVKTYYFNDYQFQHIHLSSFWGQQAQQ